MSAMENLYRQAIEPSEARSAIMSPLSVGMKISLAVVVMGDGAISYPKPACDFHRIGGV